MIQRGLVIAILLAIFFQDSFSQKAPIKYGKVSMEELQMTVYEPDTSASAVVLCDYGFFSGTTYDFTRVIRYKILKKEGLDIANRVFPGTEKGDIRGVTFNLVDGKIVEDKLKNESIFRERISEDDYRIRVAMPNVKVGSVFDVTYSYFLLPDVWYFQQKIPVKWSELVIEPITYVTYNKNLSGEIPFFIKTDTRWVTKDVPAFKDEPYTNSSENYIAKFEFNIQEVFFPGNGQYQTYYKAYTTDWNAVARLLAKNSYFGLTLSGGMFLNDAKKEISEKCHTDLEKIQAACEYIKRVKWNDEERLYTTNTSLSNCFKEKSGNSADINLMLVELLRKLDINAEPVVLSTRGNGMLSPIHPSLSKLNYVLATAKVGEKEYLLDATEDLMPAGMLPERCMNYNGKKIVNDVAIPIPLETDKKEKETAYYSMDLDTDMIFTGKINFSRNDYSAFNFRKKYEKFNGRQEYIDYLEKNFPGLSVRKMKIDNLDSIYLPVKVQYDVRIENKVDIIDSLVYISPMFDLKMTKNPFINDERKYPIVFPYQIEKSFICIIKIPKGYVVETIPAAAIFKMPDNSAQFMYSVTFLGNTINISYKFSINKLVFTTDEYTNLRELYNQIIKKHSQPVILKKV
jgi:Domain of Unknown Function with PDB structure (DUF3858)